MTIEEFLSALPTKHHKRGDHYYFKCPVHAGEHNDSASVRLGEDGRVLFTCHSQGCSYREALAALRLHDSPPAEPKEVVYPYTDENGELLYEVVRLAGKKFRQRRKVNGETVWNLNGCLRVPYHLPAVLKAVESGRRIFWVEGEKDVHTLERLGLAATTSPGGAGGKWHPEWSDYFAGANVIVLPDNDEPGMEYASKIRDKLQETAASVRLVSLPNLPPKGDVSDWIAGGKTRQDLIRAIDDPPWYSAIPLCDVNHLVIPPRAQILGPWLKEREVTMIYASRGVGKTYLACTIAIAIASGTSIFGWDCPKKRKVCYVDGEMDLGDLRERMIGIVAGLGVDMDKSDGRNIDIISRDYRARFSGGKMPYLDTPEARSKFISELNKDTEVVIFDNLSCLFGGEENDAAAWDGSQDLLISLRHEGKSVIILHHTGKSGDQRGTSRREDILDTSLCLDPLGDPDDPGPTTFQLKWRKHRSFTLTDVPPLILELNVSNIGEVKWGVRSVESERLAQILACVFDAKDGEVPNDREISKETGIPRSTVQRLLKKAKKEGLIP